MVRKRYIPKKKHDGGKHLARQKVMMQKYFPCFSCSLKKRTLECIGGITPCEDCNAYVVRIILELGGVPRVKVLDPDIPWNKKIHQYGNRNLCLYDHRKQPWKAGDWLHEKIVPWTAEWLVYYELFLLTGDWLGPEAPHGSEKAEQRKD